MSFMYQTVEIDGILYALLLIAYSPEDVIEEWELVPVQDLQPALV